MKEDTEQPIAVFREVPGTGGYFRDWSEESAEFLRTHKFKRANIRGRFLNLIFLSEYADILEELVVFNEAHIYSGIESLFNLKFLGVDDKAKKAIEFDKLLLLENCNVIWDKQYAHTLFSLPNLKKLLIRSYGEKNFSTISTNVSLTELRIIRPSIEDFRGIGALTKLEKLWLQLTTKLKTFDGIQELAQLKTLHIEDAKKVESCESIGQLQALEYLTLANTGGLENIDFLYSLPSLKVLWLPCALLVNIDWPRIIAMPLLEDIVVLFIKDIMPSEEQLREYAAACNKKIVHLEWQGTKKTPALKLKMTIGA